ncbi:MAG: nucleoside triphosphate pyrophosphohydrolase [Candidatus Schekmanbacteria bacterium]|nr:MAG: nucleoside triphosphate pyrophosphohydrolase [Candidatus Schekmanbacteria bacterium]
MKKLDTEFEKTVEIMKRLRAPDGCPWDREQTRESLKPYLIEEAYEVLEAIDNGEANKLKEELGDLLLQTVFHAQIAEEEGKFTIKDVLQYLNEKLIRRHPHVFDEKKVDSAKEVLSNWEEIKRQEGNNKNNKSILSSIPKSLPALLYAYTLQKRAARVGFDWDSVEGAMDKLDEELSEFKKAMKSGSKGELEDEIGDILFSLVNVCRFYKLHPEEALKKTCLKFVKRFRFIEEKAKERGKKIENMTLEEMDNLWEESKRKI